MRIIKFRAWDTIAKSMYLVSEMHEHTEDDGFTKKDSVLMQFTGLYDVNGREIYEGDIIKHRYFSNKGIADVRWSNEQGYYLAIEPDGSRIILRPNSEIIGNIYENPELIQNN